MRVDAAVYGYASVVTSRPCALAPAISSSNKGETRWPMLGTCTTWSAAPEGAPVLARRVARPRGERADLEPQGGRHPVVGVIAIALRVLPVGVGVDDPGRHDESLHVERVPTGGDLRGQRHDSAAQDPHIPSCVEARLGVEHAAPDEHEVVGLALRSGRPRRALEQTGDRGQAACDDTDARHSDLTYGPACGRARALKRWAEGISAARSRTTPGSARSLPLAAAQPE